MFEFFGENSAAIKIMKRRIRAIALVFLAVFISSQIQNPGARASIVNSNAAGDLKTVSKQKPQLILRWPVQAEFP